MSMRAGSVDDGIPVWAMLATPLSADARQVDRASLTGYCHAVTARGCAAVVVLGVIGEPEALTAEERETVVATALAAAPEVYVGCLSPTRARRREEIARMADRFGERVAGYLVPIRTARPAELRAEVVDLHATGGRPLVLQDYPAHSGVRIAVDDLAAAVSGSAAGSTAGSVAAVKCEAPPTFGRIRRLRELVPSVPLMSGLGGPSLVDDLSQGARLVASGISRPEIVVAAVAAWRAGDETRARALVSEVAAVAGYETQQGTSIAIRKEHWRRQGVLATSAVRAPALPYEAYLSPLSAAYGFPDVVGPAEE